MQFLNFSAVRTIQFLLICGLCAPILSAQNGTLRGSVYSRDGFEILSFAGIQLSGPNQFSANTSTDNNGVFTISMLKPGNYTLMVSMLGYQRYTKEVAIEPGEITQVKIILDPQSRELNAVEIGVDRIQDKREETKVSVTTFTPETMKRFTSVGGDPDIAQIAQTIPGFVSTGDQGGQLYIRGGPPIQNKVLMDGATIYNPFHSIGFFSVFDTDILRNFDVYSGGFGAQYGGRISSIMDLTTRDGNRSRLSGRVNLNSFTGKVLLEGPLSRVKEEGANASFLLSLKGSFLGQSSKIFYPYTTTDGLPFNFFDGYGKITLHASDNGSKVNFFGFNHNDWVNFNQSSELNWRSSGGGANFFLVPSGANMNVEGVFSYSNYQMELREDAAPPRFSEINGFNFNINFHQFYGTNRLTYGIEANGFSTDYRYLNAQNRVLSQTENTTEFAAFTQFKWNVKRFVFDPSVRLHYYASLNEVFFEPRLAMKMNVASSFRLKAAVGMYSQNFIAANSDRDVVNLFYGFLSGTNNLPKTFKGENVTSNLQKANHFILGAEWEITKYIDFNLEGYFMDFNQLVNINRDKLVDDTPVNNAVPDYLKKDFIRERGYSAGLDFLVKFEYKDWYVWVGYSVMTIQREDELREYTPHFDRTHNTNLVASYKFGRKKNWMVNARWNFGTGFPFTQTQGFYENVNFQNGIVSDYLTQPGELGIQLGPLNQGRMPSYHRLDVNISREFKFSNRAFLEVNVGATNVYNRNNIFYVDRITARRVDQLPIIPTVGLNFRY